MMMKKLISNRTLHQPDPAQPHTRRLPKPPPTLPIPTEEEKNIQPFIT